MIARNESQARLRAPLVIYNYREQPLGLPPVERAVPTLTNCQNDPQITILSLANEWVSQTELKLAEYQICLRRGCAGFLRRWPRCAPCL